MAVSVLNASCARRTAYRLLLLAAAVLLTRAARAQSDAFFEGDTSHTLAFRTSLTIGDGVYDHVGSLGESPLSDAESVHQALGSLRFDDKLLPNPTRTDFLSALDHLSDRLKNRPGLLLVYFAGHGVTINNVGYLVPRDAPDLATLRGSAHAWDYLVSLQTVFEAIQRAGPRAAVVVVDACRNNLAESPAPIQASPSEPRLPNVHAFVAYSVLPGGVASNGADGTSPFTQAWLTLLRRPHLEISEMFKRIRWALSQPPVRQNGPAYDDLDGDVHFMMTRTEFDAEKAVFDNVTHNGNSRDYWGFMTAYPAGYFYEEAKIGYDRAAQQESIKQLTWNDANSSAVAARPGTIQPMDSHSALSYGMSSSMPFWALDNTISRMHSWTGKELAFGGNKPDFMGVSRPEPWRWTDLPDARKGDKTQLSTRYAGDLDSTWNPSGKLSLPVTNTSHLIVVDPAQRQANRQDLQQAVDSIGKSRVTAIVLQEVLPVNASSNERVAAFSAIQQTIRALVDREVPRDRVVILNDTVTGNLAVTLRVASLPMPKPATTMSLPSE